MADTSQQELSEPHTNGAVDGLTEEEKSKMRPADIDADMREMERRKRVEIMMNSRLFREELERIIETQMKDGGAGPSGLLQQISDMMGAQGARFNSNVFKSSNCVVPINDIRGVESMGYAKGEKLLRCKLAAIFRLLDLYGWTQGVGGQITARLNQDQEHFLVNPYGLLYHEVTASSLVKVDMQGSIVEQGTTNFGVHITGFQLHSTIHAARPDIKCIVHITTPSVIAVSSLKCGLLPLSQESIVVGETSTHQYIGGVFEPEEKEKISRNLGPVNKIMFLTNRGALCCGETVEEAFYNVYNTVLACETQLKLIPAGIDNLNLVSEESRKAIFEASRKPPVPQQASVAEPSPLADKLEKRWRIGGTEFEALMRMLDNAGFRTGYIYRHPLVKGEPPRPRNDVEVPPAVSSLGYLLEEEELYKQGLWKGGRKGTDRSRWLNSPNVYQKVEILETGTPDPKKITKWVDLNAEEWVSDGSPTHSSTPVKIESALQFVPKNTNPKEFKQLQQQIKDYRRADKISAGPQSHILEGVTWDEAKKMQDATISATGEQVVLVGAASKGIIQRGFQHNAMVYKTPYAKNPFDAVTDQELDQYKKDVERKQKGDPYDESQSESEALSSFNVSRATHESSTAKSPIQSPVSVTSETEEESRDEPRVLRIETKQVPVPSQPEVVLSDEPTSFAQVVDTLLAQQAQIQEVEKQSPIIQPKPAVDATTEFLNELRRTAIVEPRNDLNRRDCQSSNCSSISSGHSYGWSTEPYDTIQLEVARSRTVAPRMTPLITEIVHSSNTKTVQPNSTNVKIKQPPPVPPKPKPYLALRHAFFNNFLPTVTLAQTSNSHSTLIDVNSYTSSIPNNNDEILSVNYTLNKTQVAGFSETLNIRTEEPAVHIEKKIENENLNNINTEPKHDHKLLVEPEVRNIDSVAVTRQSANNMTINTAIENLYLSQRLKANSTERILTCTDFLDKEICMKSKNNDEADFHGTGNTSPKPVIVGAILKNINDLHTLCARSNDKSTELCTCQEVKSTEEQIGHENSFEEQDLSNKSDENGNLYGVSKESSANDQGISKINISKTIIDSGVDENLNSPEENYSEKLSEKSLNSEVEIFMENIVNKEASPNLQNKFITIRKENEINNNPEQFPILQDIPEFQNNAIDCSPSKIWNPVSSTPPCTPNYFRLESLTDVINSVNIDLTPTKMLPSILPKSDTSSKYNLDSTNMSLIYSLTPTNDSDDDMECKVIKKRTLDELNGSFDNTAFRRLESCNTDDSVHDEESDYIWVDLLGGPKKNNELYTNNTMDLSDGSMESLAECDNLSNQGSDILELPYSTVCELRETDGESFNHDIKTMANQIIAELGDIEIYTHASNFVDEILYDISCLKLDENYNKHTISTVVQDKLQALGIAKDVANTLISNLPCYEKDVDAIDERNDTMLSNSCDSCDNEANKSLIVIEELVHHVIEMFELNETSNNSSPESYNLKKVKETTNTELKETQNSFKPQSEECNNNGSCETNHDTSFLKKLSSMVTASEMNESFVPEESVLSKEIEPTKSGSIEVELNENLNGVDNFANEPFRLEMQESSAEGFDSFRNCENERYFITLDSPTNFSGIDRTSSVNESLNDVTNKGCESSKMEHTDLIAEFYCSCQSCPSPLDCDECSFVRFRKYGFMSDQDCSNYHPSYTDAISSSENTESDLTDHDTLGEAILEFCTITKPSQNAQEMELNFSIERSQAKDKTVSSNISDDFKIEVPNFIPSGQLAPIFEEDPIENFGTIQARKKRTKTENQLDFLDYFSDSESLISGLFDECIAALSSDKKTHQISPDVSIISFESANTLDYHSCKDDSYSTAFQSIQNTLENSPAVIQNEKSALEKIYAEKNAEDKLDRTYTLSDTSINSLGTVSSIESDEHKNFKKLFIDDTYSADISTNMDETRLPRLMHDTSSSSSSDVLLSNANHYFDITTNLADVSDNILQNNFEKARTGEEDGQSENSEEKESDLRSSPVFSCLNKDKLQDCMSYSYDTREFMLLEEALTVGSDVKSEIAHCTCSQEKCKKIYNGLNTDNNGLSPLDPPPRYEDTTLCKVVSQINLTDLFDTETVDVPDSSKY